VLELAILGALKEHDLHGYELKRRLTQTLGGFSSVSFGSLYPALGRLEKSGAVKAVDAFDPPPAQFEAPPATGSLGAELAVFRSRVRSPRPDVKAPPRGRSRKVYGITAQGERMFHELLADAAGSTTDDRSFNLRLAFARHLPVDARLGLLEGRRAALVERLARGRRCLKASADDPYGRALLEHGTEATEHDISWIDRLIAAEREQIPPREDNPS
jgi:DNA-binding PadR family transcriptional regulator